MVFMPGPEQIKNTGLLQMDFNNPTKIKCTANYNGCIKKTWNSVYVLITASSLLDPICIFLQIKLVERNRPNIKSREKP